MKHANDSKRTYMLITIPILALFVCFNTIPLIRGVIYSFTNFKGFGTYDFVGFRNYIDLFTDPRIGGSYWFTIKLAIVATIVTNVISLLLAIGLNSKIKGKTFLRAAYFIPNVLGALVVGYIFQYFFTYILLLMAGTLIVAWDGVDFITAFGASLAIIAGFGAQMTMLMAFGFGILTVVLVWLVSSRAKGKRVMSLILAGIVISSLFEAGTSYIKLVADPNEALPKITYWLMGSLSGTTRDKVSFVFLPMLIGLVILFVLRWQLGVLTMGDEEARTMGVNAKVVRPVIILASTLITAAAVSVCGAIGWVGLVIPHLCRRLVGSNTRYLMPASMVGGALFLLIVDNISRNLYATELPIGILTAFVGAPFFLYLMMKGGDVT